MKLHELFVLDPRTSKLANQGVAKVAEDFAAQEETLRFELQTFVCEGQYEKGLEKILETALQNCAANREQPGFWISGYFGSGKSHLAKMLRVLWTDYVFSDGARARGIARLPDSIKAHLKELDTTGKRIGGLHAASGTLNSSASGHVRMAIAGIVARSLGLPESWHKAQFVLWLRERGIEEKLKEFVKKQGGDWDFELNNLVVSKYIVPGLIEIDSTLGTEMKEVRNLLSAQFPQKQDISNQELTNFVEQSLKQSYNGHIPFTLIVIDEVQQYAGHDPNRAVMVQEVLETLCSHFKGKLLIVATGQMALRETPNLQRLMGRFPISIQLSETDVETVTRRVILAKTLSSVDTIEQVINKYEGEIARQLQGTAAGWFDAYRAQLVNDYPLLPGRRRFFEVVMQSVDTTGTGSQLRSQLDIIQRALAVSAEEKIEYIVPGDQLYDLNASNLLQLSSLPRSSYEEIQRLDNGGTDDKFKARVLKLVFLLSQIKTENPKGKGLRSTQEIMVDLLVSRFDGERNELTQKLPLVLQDLVESNLLQKLPSGEYCMQTPEGQAWVQEFQKQETSLRQSTAWLDSEVRAKFQNLLTKQCKDLQEIPHGKCQIRRSVQFCFDAQPPKESGLSVWAQNGRDSDLQIVRAEAAKAGMSSTCAFVFIPIWGRDELENSLIEWKSANTTLGLKGIPTNDEGRNAKKAMENRLTEAERKTEMLLLDSLAHSSVFTGGGTEISGDSVKEKISTVLKRALPVLYPKFDEADHAKWGDAYDKAIKGHPDALKVVEHNGEIEAHPVCRQLLNFIGTAGRKGDEIRKNFMGGQYGWEQDAVDTALAVLVANGKIRAHTPSSKEVSISNWERKQITQYLFKTETVVLSQSDYIKIRAILQKNFGIATQPQEEAVRVRDALAKLVSIGQSAGGNPPAPQVPISTILEEISSESGNAQLKLFLDNSQEIISLKTEWERRASLIDARMPRWELLKELLEKGSNLLPVKEIKAEADAIMESRLLLQEPDPIEDLIQKACNALRSEVNTSYDAMKDVYTKELNKLRSINEWNKLEEDKRTYIIKDCNITEPVEPLLGSPEEIVATLRMQPVRSWEDSIDALPHRFDTAYKRAVAEVTPKARALELPPRTISCESELEEWVREIHKIISEAIKQGPVILK